MKISHLLGYDKAGNSLIEEMGLDPRLWEARKFLTDGGEYAPSIGLRRTTTKVSARMDNDLVCSLVVWVGSVAIAEIHPDNWKETFSTAMHHVGLYYLTVLSNDPSSFLLSFNSMAAIGAMLIEYSFDDLIALFERERIKGKDNILVRNYMAGFDKGVVYWATKEEREWMKKNSLSF